MQTENTTQVYEAAITYAKRGWCVIPVHGIIAGTTDRCTCTWIDCPNPGKHPIEKDWPDTRLSTADIYTIFVETYPYANVGVITGEPSGIFAIDIDPKNGGDITLAALLLEHGTLPDTYTQKSGSGGEHYLFNLPDFVVKGDSSRGEKAFGPGIDIRGHRNMIVMAGSRSDKGEYLPQTDFPTCVPPEWVEEKLRAHYTRTNNTEEDITVIEGLPEHSRLEPHEQERVQRYAVRAIEAECLAYAQALPGRGNDQLFKSACNILEIVQSPWNTVTLQNARDLLDRARLKRIEIHQYNGGQTPNEFSGVWRSARSTVAGQGRPYPEDKSTQNDFEYEDDQKKVSKEKVTQEDDTQNDFDDSEEVKVPDGLPKTKAMERILKHLHDRDQLDDILPPIPLISRVIDVGTSVVLAGSFGTFKTFASIGWACSVATGEPWLGHHVITPGTVLYIAAEGASGIKRRVAAWEKRTGVRVPKDKLRVIDVSVSIASDEDMKALIALVGYLDIKMVIFDTLHRCSSPLDENSNTDMGRLNVVAGAMREKNNITTVYVHHAGHTGTRSRGASSIEDDSDCAWVTELTGDGDNRDPRIPRVMKQRKTKDSPELEDFFVRLDLVDGTESGWLELCDENGVAVEDGIAGVYDSPFEDAGYEPGVISTADPAQIARDISVIKQVFMDAFQHGTAATKSEVRRLSRDRKRAHHISNDTGFFAAWDTMLSGDQPLVGKIGSTEKYRLLNDNERSLRLTEESE